MPCCSTPHIASRKSDTTRISVSRASARGRHGAVVRLEQDRVLVRRQLVVDAEVAEVEERVAHAGVLPVDDPDARPVIDEVGVEQVVVARPELDRRREAGELDPARDRLRRASYSAGMRTPRARPARDTPRRCGSGTNRPGIAGPPWIRRRESRHPREHVGLADLRVATGVPSMNRVTR